MNKIFNLENARVQELNVFENCIAAFTKILGAIGADYDGPPWKVVQVTGNQQLRELFADKKKIVFPFVSLLVETLRNPSDLGGMYNPQVAYNGIPLGVLSENDATPLNCILHFKQVAVDCKISVIAQSFTDVVKFSQRFLFKERSSQFTLSTSTYNIPIKVTFNTDLSIPQEEFTEFGNLFFFEASAVLYCYIGCLELKPTITRMNVSVQAASETNENKIEDFSVGIPK